MDMEDPFNISSKEETMEELRKRSGRVEPITKLARLGTIPSLDWILLNTLGFDADLHGFIREDPLGTKQRYQSSLCNLNVQRRLL